MNYSKEKFESAEKGLSAAEANLEFQKSTIEHETNPFWKLIAKGAEPTMRAMDRILADIPFVTEAKMRIKKLYAAAETEARGLEAEHEQLLAQVRTSGEDFAEKIEALRKFEAEKLGMHQES